MIFCFRWYGRGSLGKFCMMLGYPIAITSSSESSFGHHLWEKKVSHVTIPAGKHFNTFFMVTGGDLRRTMQPFWMQDPQWWRRSLCHSSIIIYKCCMSRPHLCNYLFAAPYLTIDMNPTENGWVSTYIREKIFTGVLNMMMLQSVFIWSLKPLSESPVNTLIGSKFWLAIDFFFQ